MNGLLWRVVPNGRRKSDVDREVAEELAFHLEERARELEEQGHPPEEARRLARASFGDVASVARACSRIQRAGTWSVFSLGAALALVLVGALAFLLFGWLEGVLGRPHASPFEAVCWREDVPQVRVDGDWYGLAELDGIEAEEIVAHAKESETSAATGFRHRFNAELPELLREMGHDPERQVDLLLFDLETGEHVPMPGVPMTSDKREAVVRGNVEPWDLRISPFEEVQWRGDRPLVLVDERWYELTSVDGVPIEEITTFAEGVLFGDWKRRFVEDNFQLFELMGLAPDRYLDLGAVDLESGEPVLLEGIEATAEKRRRAYTARNFSARRPAEARR